MDGENNNNETWGLGDFTAALGSHNVDTGGLGSYEGGSSSGRPSGPNQGFGVNQGSLPNQGFVPNQGFGMPPYMAPYNVGMPSYMPPYNVYMQPNVGANQGFGMPPSHFVMSLYHGPSAYTGKSLQRYKN